MELPITIFNELLPFLAVQFSLVLVAALGLHIMARSVDLDDWEASGESDGTLDGLSTNFFYCFMWTFNIFITQFADPLSLVAMQATGTPKLFLLFNAVFALLIQILYLNALIALLGEIQDQHMADRIASQNHLKAELITEYMDCTNGKERKVSVSSPSSLRPCLGHSSTLLRTLQ